MISFQGAKATPPMRIEIYEVHHHGLKLPPVKDKRLRDRRSSPPKLKDSTSQE